MQKSLSDFREIWCISVEYEREPGECPRPLMVVGRECRSGRDFWLGHSALEERAAIPHPVDENSLLVTFDAPAVLGVYLSLRWPLPTQVLDLHAEFRCLRSGLEMPDDDWENACEVYCPDRGDSSRSGARLEIIHRLLQVLAPLISLPHALLRGRYTAAVARMERTGVPIDVDLLNAMRSKWNEIRESLIADVDRDYGVYRRGQLDPRHFRAWLNRNRIRWPRFENGNLRLDLNTFSDMARVNPRIRPLKELQATLAKLRNLAIAVGADGRNRCPLNPFRSKTGRNQPSSSRFIFGCPRWLRGLILPRDGTALAYLDYEQQEFGIAAALSHDSKMIKAYVSGDPYLAFAQQAGAVSAGASREAFRDIRERFKHCAIGVQYGMGPQSLSIRLNIGRNDATRLISLHRRTYRQYWEWSDEVWAKANRQGYLESAFGWRVNVGKNAKSRSVKNFPLQANGAEMLRLACCALTEEGIRVCAPVHDALLIEADATEIEAAISRCQQVMAQASLSVLGRLPLRTAAHVVRFPQRYRETTCASWKPVLRELTKAQTPRRLLARTCAL